MTHAARACDAVNPRYTPFEYSFSDPNGSEARISPVAASSAVATRRVVATVNSRPFA